MSLPLRLLAVASAILLFAPPSAAQSPSTGSLSADHLAGIQPREIGPATMSGRIVDLAVVEKDPRIFYVATSTGGIWKTADNGIRWTALFQDQPVHSMGDIAVHQTDTAVVWAGTGERASRQSNGWGDGVYRSEDGGATWSHMGLDESRHIGRITLHPDDSNVVYVASMGHLWGPNEEDRGLYRSMDGGQSWDRILYVDEETGAVDVRIDPENPEILYAAMYQRRRRPWGFHGGGPGSGLYKSVDGGDSWTRLTNAGLENGLPTGDIGRIGIDIYRSDPNIVYASIEQGERYNASTAYEQREAGLYRSEDRGETWELMSDWNPRPMYASQPKVDPSDDQRVYMMNSYSYSDDGGETFTQPRGDRTHGDDRLVWVNPEDSNHVMKADDGGLGISYDRGNHFLYVTNLPVSQWYRVSVDMAHPYHIYGGLQDNGSWRGPSQVYRSEGIINQDWTKWGGGDGFLTLVDTTDNRTSYVESQYLGLNRNDLVTGEEKFIRPNQPEGYIAPRRNWDTWPDLSDPEQRLGNAMPPGNWDGPFIISPHDNHTLYAGLNELYKSTDQGDSWRALGDLTTQTDRRTLEIMDQEPDSFVLSLDDGIPYWPTLTAVAESEFTPGILYVGTDDGQVQVSRDDGESWTNVTDRLPGAPEMMWVNAIHPSKLVEGRLYLAANNYRNDDYGNYAWRSDDDGMTWERVTGDLPAEQVVRVVRDDQRNPDVLWMATEFGAFWSRDGGASWHELDAGFPTVAVNDLVVHPRDNDLVLATHGRGVWILDQVNAFQELTPEVQARPAHLFSIEPAEQIRYRSDQAHTGNMIFEGENPPAGAILDYWLAEGGTSPGINVFDEAGDEVAVVPAPDEAGLNRAVWNLRHSMADGGSENGLEGPFVVPGLYTVRLELNGTVSEQVVRVLEDPRIDADVLVRAQWTETRLDIARTLLDAQAVASEVAEQATALEDGELDPSEDDAAELRDLNREFDELTARLSRLYSATGDWVGPLSADHASQRAFLEEMLDTLGGEWSRLRDSLDQE